MAGAAAFPEHDAGKVVQDYGVGYYGKGPRYPGSHACFRVSALPFRLCSPQSWTATNDGRPSPREGVRAAEREGG